MVGLLGERDLLAGDGLLIVPSQGVHTLGMLFAIDIMVLDGEWNVIAIRRELRPFRLTRVFWKAAVVLELPGGAQNRRLEQNHRRKSTGEILFRFCLE